MSRAAQQLPEIRSYSGKHRSGGSPYPQPEPVKILIYSRIYPPHAENDAYASAKYRRGEKGEAMFSYPVKGLHVLLPPMRILPFNELNAPKVKNVPRISDRAPAESMALSAPQTYTVNPHQEASIRLECLN